MNGAQLASVEQIRQLIWSREPGNPHAPLPKNLDLAEVSIASLEEPEEVRQRLRIELLKNRALQFGRGMKYFQPPTDDERLGEVLLELLSLQKKFGDTPAHLAISHQHTAMFYLERAASSLANEEQRTEAFLSARHHLNSCKFLRDKYELRDSHPELADIERLLKIAEGIRQRNVQTVVCFVLPFEIPLNDGKYDGMAEDGVPFSIVLSVERMTPTHSTFMFERGHLIGDRQGQLNRTKVEVQFSGYADPLEPMQVPLDTADEDGQVQRLFEYTRHLLNRFVQLTRAESGDFRIPRLAPTDILEWDVKVLCGGEKWIDLTQGLPHHEFLLPAVGKLPWDVRLSNKVRERLLTGFRVPTYRVFLLEAKEALLVDNRRAAVILANTSFESFLRDHIKVRLRDALSESEIEDFLRGETSLERARDELLRLGYKELADMLPDESGLDLTPGRRSAFSLMRKMHKIRPFEGIGWEELETAMKTIAYSRNDVAHGNVDDSDIDPEKVSKAIAKLEWFIELALRTSKNG